MNEDVPRFRRVDDFPPTEGTEFLDDESDLPNGVKLRRTHFWKRIAIVEIECGDTRELTFTRKIGITESLLNEVSTGFEIPLGMLKATLGTKLSSSAATTDESTTQYKIAISSPACDAIRHAEWQRVDRITLTASRRRWFGLLKQKTVERIIDTSLNVYKPDRFIYPSPHCCQDDFSEKLRDGYDELHSASFADVKILAMSRLERNGELSFAGVPGRWRPGQAIPGSAFAQRFTEMGEPVPSEDGVIDLNGLGSARQLLDFSPDLVPQTNQAHECPTVPEILSRLEDHESEAVAQSVPNGHSFSQCRRCETAASFFRTLTPKAREKWAESNPVVLALPSPLHNLSAETDDDAANRTHVSQTGLRAHLLERRGKLLFEVTAWNSELAGKEVEVLVLGERPRRSHFRLHADSGGILAGEALLKVSAARWSAHGESRIVLIRFVEPSSYRQLIRRVAGIFHRRGEAEFAPAHAVPAVAAIETEVVSVGPLMGGIIRSVRGSIVTIEAAVDSGLHIGQSLHVYHNRVFVGVAVVSRTVPGGALLEFQPAGETLPTPGDVVMVPETE